jgi:predicted phosphodiesterase
MLIFVGDIHGDFEILRRLVPKLDKIDNPTIIQVGDFGYWPSVMETYPEKYPYPVYFIDGNHEYFPDLLKLSQEIPSEVKHNLFYVPRGTVLTLSGITIGFMGGGMSLDKRTREVGTDWFPHEQVTLDDIAKLENTPVDMLVTHTPPAAICRLLNFHSDLREWGLQPEDNAHQSEDYIQRLWEKAHYVPIVSGHLHRSAVGHDYRVLDINEVCPHNPYS